MKQLVEVIIQSKLVGFGSVVPVSEYRSVFPDAKDYDPYFLALRHTIINMAYIGKLGHDDMKLCFEDSTTTSNRAKAIYDEFKEFTEWSWHKNLSGFTTATKKLMALQAADMIAREAYKHADNLGIRKTRKPVKVMNRRLCFHVWDRRTLEHLKQRGGPDNLEALTGWPWDATAPQTIQFFGPTFDLA